MPTKQKQKTEVWYVNVYELDRHYGGPEEGGWWYDSGTLITSIPLPSKHHAEEHAALLRETDYRSTGNVSSVIYRGGAYSVEVSNEPGADFPTKRPFYE